MDIVLTTNGTRTLVDVVIVNLTHVDLISQVAYSWGMATMIITQTKVVSYHDHHLEEDFIPLIIKIFGCLHQ
jgi:hypothetical protein